VSGFFAFGGLAFGTTRYISSLIPFGVSFAMIVYRNAQIKKLKESLKVIKEYNKIQG
jgi:hypothetical protein